MNLTSPPGPRWPGSCQLRMFVYHTHLAKMNALFRYGRHFDEVFIEDEQEQLAVFRNWSRASSCLEKRCYYNSFGFHNNRAFTGDVPIYDRLMSTCPQVDDPAQADFFLVPWCFGAVSTFGWDKVKKRRRAKELRALEKHSTELLSPQALEHYSSATADRHVILYSQDVQFLFGLHPQLTDAVLRAIIVHLGDDHWIIGPLALPHRRCRYELTNDLVVPYRVSHWLQPPSRSPAVTGPWKERHDEPHPRKFLLLANINANKSSFRRHLLESLRAETKELNLSEKDRKSVV